MSSKLKSSKRYPRVFTRSIKSRVDQKKDTHFFIRFTANGKARKEMVGTQLREEIRQRDGFWKDICEFLEKTINSNTPLCKLCLYYS